MSKNKKLVIVVIILFMSLVVFTTKFYGGADTFDYQDSAKFFTGDYPAKMRSSHSYLYGFVHSWIVEITNSFIIFKITSLVSLGLIIYSVYLISGRNKNALWLGLISPIVWYMGPWTSPIQIASLSFLWGYYFTKQYCLDNKINSLFYAGLLVGLSWAFWDGVLFFIPLFIISFFYNEKLIHTIYFSIFILLGSLPRIILDLVLFDSIFFTPIRHILASLALTFTGGFYNQGGLWGIIPIIFVILFLPVLTYLLFTKKEIYQKNKKTSIFIFLSIILLIINSQIRFILLIAPIILVTISPHISKKQYTSSIIFSTILVLLVVNPYIIQSKWDLGIDEKGVEIYSFVLNTDKIKLSDSFTKEIIDKDLQKITTQIKDESFVIGDSPDSYRILANFYTGDKISEFVSVEDYNLNKAGKLVIAQKELCSEVKINERRDFCFSISTRKAFNDKTNYSSIRYGISLGDNLGTDGFVLKQKYEMLSLWEKISP